MERKLVLGLDIGVASVGWGIVDKNTGKIVDKGVRLFSSSDPQNNVDRRSFRHTRRLIRRKEFRLYRTRRVLLDMGLIKDISFLPLNNPYEIRCKGLKQRLDNDELATAILHLMKRNGFRYEIVEDDETSGISKIKEDFLCEHQLKLLKENGKVRGTDNKYHYSLYEKEFDELLKVQGVDKEHADLLKKIFSERRHYSVGPGGENSPSIYGRYLYLGAEPIDLIAKMRGKCSIYKEEFRAPKICPSSELHNFLNDINNLTIHGQHINYENKNEIINTYILGKGKITPKQLANYLGTSLQNIDGFRLKKDEPILTDFVSLKKVKDAVKKADLPEFAIDSFDDLLLLDDVFDCLTSTKIYEERQEKLKALNNKKIDKYIDCFAKISGVSMYHSLSFKALRILNEELLDTSLNTQQIIKNLNLGDDDGNVSLSIPSDAIISPVVKKSVNQSFKIIKAINKKYGQLESIVIEMPRVKNLNDEKKVIKDAQANKLKEKEHVLDIIGDILGDKKPNREIIEKVLFYEEQDGKSAYSGKPLDLRRMILDPSYTEIDHIIPYSISFDDSRSNKVVVLQSENQHKGNRTPKQAFATAKDWQSFADFEAITRNSSKLSPKKKSNLLYEKDIRTREAMEEFSSRNLNDTRYACSIVLNTVKKYFKSQDIDTKVFVVNGKTTSVVRGMANLAKDRNYHSHHAVDALIIASFSQSTYLSNAFDNRLYDEETGEVFEKADMKTLFGPVIDSVAKQLINYDPIKDFKFSYKIDTKPNRCISDQTLYGTRIINNELFAIKKYKNIYDKNGETVTQIIRDNDTKKINSLLIYKNDIKSYNLLKTVVDSYPNEKNAFAAYYKEQKELIKKVSNSHQCPSITSLKYIDAKVGISLDLSKKYHVSKKNVGNPVKLQLSPYRMDLYKSDKGFFKFVCIRFADIKFKKGFYFINEKYYQSCKESVGIDSSYQFINSFYRDDLIERTFKDENTLLERFKVVNNSLKQVVELSYFGHETQKIDDNGNAKNFQYMQTFGRNVLNIRKFSTDILGNMFLVQNEPLKLKWK